MDLNAEWKIDLNSRIYENLNEPTKNLLFRMLEVNPKIRITVGEALNHEFFKIMGKLDGEGKIESLKVIPE